MKDVTLSVDFVDCVLLLRLRFLFYLNRMNTRLCHCSRGTSHHWDFLSTSSRRFSFPIRTLSVTPGTETSETRQRYCSSLLPLAVRIYNTKPSLYPSHLYRTFYYLTSSGTLFNYVHYFFPLTILLIFLFPFFILFYTVYISISVCCPPECLYFNLF